MKVKFIFGLILFLGIRGSFAQITQARDFIPQILPASPEAASFSKFGNYQVNLFTGLPDINIPLYEIKIGELSVPIGISYHAAGIKVNDMSSWVGLGWNLNAGGSISRKMMGLPDEQSGNYLSGQTVRAVSSLDPNTQADLDYLRVVSQGAKDVEPDIFSYNFPGKNGKFVFNQANNNQPIMIPYDPISITFNQTFGIIDERGVSYQFRTDEYTTTSVGGITTQGYSTWPLTQITSANKQDNIYFNYTSHLGTVNEDYRDLIILNDNVNNQLPNIYNSDFGNGYTDDIFVGVNEQKIQQILFPNGQVVFDPSVGDRSDGYTGQKSLSDIKVYSYNKTTNTYTLIKSVNFYQSYFINPTDNTVKRLRLDSLVINDNNGNVIEKYRFNYNTSVDLPNKLSRSRDYWGYYNGKPNNTMVPQITGVGWQSTYNSTPTTITIGSNIPNGRDPDPSYMQAYMLQRIYFPSGGYTDFEYETNQYLELPSTIKYAGGLRVKTIKNYDGTNPNPVIKSYKYGSGESGYGRKNFILTNYFFQTTQNNQFFTDPVGCPLLSATKRVRTFISNPNIEIEPYDGSPVVYSSVTEYSGDITTNIGKTIFTYNDQPDALNTTVTTGKPVLTTYYENRGQLIDKQDYKNLGNNTYQLIAETQNNYTAFPEQFYYNLGLVVFKTTISDDQNGGSDVALSSFNNEGICVYNDSHNYVYANYAIRTQDNELTQTINYVYDQNNPSSAVVTKTDFYYDNINNLQVTRAYTVNSLGDSIKIYRKYPHDYSTSTPYNTMIGLNIINKVVQEQKLKNNTQLNLQINNYAAMGNGNYLPDSISYQLASNPIETRAYFNSYDLRGNILEMQKSNDVKLSYIWDYQNIYPIAEVANAAQNQIAYTSFEADGNGNWTITDPYRSTEFVTGNQSFVLNNSNNITYSFASGGFNFILSYWSKDGPVTLGGITVVNTITGATKNGWTYYEHTITANTGNAVTISTTSSAKTIDELRLYPSTAKMSTSTYSPLVGITSQCTVNNTVTYYSYDKYNRLRFIRDADGNVIKTMEYHFQGNTNSGF